MNFRNKVKLAHNQKVMEDVKEIFNFIKILTYSIIGIFLFISLIVVAA